MGNAQHSGPRPLDQTNQLFGRALGRCREETQDVLNEQCAQDYKKRLTGRAESCLRKVTTSIGTGANECRDNRFKSLNLDQSGRADFLLFAGEGQAFLGRDEGTVSPLVSPHTRMAAGVMEQSVKGPGGQHQQPNQNAGQEWSLNPFHVPDTLRSTPNCPRVGSLGSYRHSPVSNPLAVA